MGDYQVRTLLCESASRQLATIIAGVRDQPTETPSRPVVLFAAAELHATIDTMLAIDSAASAESEPFETLGDSAHADQPTHPDIYPVSASVRWSLSQSAISKKDPTPEWYAHRAELKQLADQTAWMGGRSVGPFISLEEAHTIIEYLASSERKRNAEKDSVA